MVESVPLWHMFQIPLPPWKLFTGLSSDCQHLPCTRWPKMVSDSSDRVSQMLREWKKITHFDFLVTLFLIKYTMLQIPSLIALECPLASFHSFMLFLTTEIR